MSLYVDTCLFSAFTWIWYVLPKARVLRLGLWLGATHRWWKFWEARPRGPLVTEDIPLEGLMTEGSSLPPPLALWLTMR